MDTRPGPIPPEETRDASPPGDPRPGELRPDGARPAEAVQDPFLALSILKSLNIAVLRRLEPRVYSVYGSVPPFYSRLFPGEKNAPCVSPWDYSEMLEFFLEDAEMFFDRNEDGALSSGIWQEEGVQDGAQALLAEAMSFGRDKVLILRLLSDDYSDRVRILQKARENLLERRMLNNDLELYKQKARFDPLTTLYNRASFLEALQEEIARAATSGSDLSLLLLDIDDFRAFNEAHGQHLGDEVLSSLGQILHSSLRREDLAARYGGEEFAILAPFTMQNQAYRMAEKIRQRVEQHAFAALPKITVSVGCATYLHGEQAESFLQRADLALFDAKKHGKNLVRMR